MQLEAGLELGNYRLISELGVGGMGVVWRATDLSLGREIALKVLSAQFAFEPDRVEHFRREARTLASLNHDNIVTVHSVEQAHGVHFITMEWVEGRTLAESIPPDGVPAQRFLDWATTLTGAIDAAHRKGIVHRDLKPANIMIRDDGRPIILDFGLAALRASPAEGDPALAATRPESIVASGAVAGTPFYMSPEQITGRPVDQRTDLFSLGVILHEMATANRPFDGETFGELQAAVLGETPPSISVTRRDLDPRLDDVLSRCLAKRREDRFQSAAELLRALERLRHPRPWIGRGRRALLAAALAAPALLLALSIVAFRSVPQREQPVARLAVLPFENLTGDPELDYLGRGISRGLISQLGEVASVQVLGSSTFWGDDPIGSSPLERARQRGATKILDGSVLRRDGRLVVSVELAPAQSGVVGWSDEFTSGSDDPMELQRQIGGELARVLSIDLSAAELERVLHHPTGSARAYDLLLRADGILERATERTEIETAISLLEQAVLLDPEFASARARLSQALLRRYRMVLDKEDLVAAGIQADAALRFAPELPAALLASALVDRDSGRFEASIEKLTRTLSRSARPAEANLELAATVAALGDHETAEELYRTAVALAPEAWGNWNDLGGFYFDRQRWTDARDAFEQAAGLAPNGVWIPLENLAGLDLALGDVEAAIAIYDRLPRPVRNHMLASNIGSAFYFSNRPDRWEQAERYYTLAVELNPASAGCQGNLGDLYMITGRKSEALERYRRALALNEQGLEVNPRDPDALLGQPVFAAWTGDCARALAALAALENESDGEADGSLLKASALTLALCGEVDRAVAAVRELLTATGTCEPWELEPALSKIVTRPEIRSEFGCRGDAERIPAS